MGEERKEILVKHISSKNRLVTICSHTMFTIYSLYVHYMFTICLLYVNFTFILCSLYIHFMITICALHVRYTFIICSLYVHCIFWITRLEISYVELPDIVIFCMGEEWKESIVKHICSKNRSVTIWSLYVQYMFTVCSLYVHLMFTIIHFMLIVCSLYYGSQDLRLARLGNMTWWSPVWKRLVKYVFS